MNQKLGWLNSVYMFIMFAMQHHFKDKLTKGLQHAHDKLPPCMLSQPAIDLDLLHKVSTYTFL